MFKKTTIIIFVIFAAVLVAAFTVFSIYSKRSAGPSGETEASSPIFPQADFSQNTGEAENSGESGGGANVEDYIVPKLRMLFDKPVSGAVLFESDGKTFVRFVEKSTGHVYEMEPDSVSAKRVTNTTIPRTNRVVWGGRGDRLVLQYMDEGGDVMESFYAKIDELGDLGEFSLSGLFLPKNLVDVMFSPDEEDVFYITKTGGKAVGDIANPESESLKRVFSHDLSEWVGVWVNKNNIILSTKPSYRVLGYLFKLNPETGSLSKILGPIPGMTALPRDDMKKIVYARNDTDSYMGVYEISLKKDLRLPIWSLTDKCAWGTGEAEDIIYCGVPNTIGDWIYPDDWYTGKVSTSDSLWSINTNDGSTEMLINPETAVNEEIDVVNPFMDKKGLFVFFINKKDGMLWEFRI